MFGRPKITKTLHIEGMSCMHCAARVSDTLKKIKEVADADVRLDEKLAVVRLKSDVADDVLTAAVENAGFTVVGIE
ncbi:MAG: heavy-metal-associated domain-containing protein [Clostridia bacterium]|nr:heavy-metal-associated domain-containing protein [Clostridia bacterium]